MSGPDEKTPDQPPADAPAPDEADAGAPPATGASPAADAESRLDVAKRFLEEASVKDSPREKKVEFLRSKDLTDDEIESLLGHEPAQQTTASPESPQPSQPQEAAPRPPIITYPEFLATPTSKPLLSTTTLLNAFYVLTGLTTLLHGTKRYYVDPALTTQTTARHELSETTSSHLSALLSKLEATVSSIPTTTPDDDASTCSDPTELFSRDVGTQTSPTPVLPTKNEPPPASSHAQKLTALSHRLSDLREGLDAQVDTSQEAMAIADALREQLREASVARSYANLGWSQPEPDDEVKKVKENIRRLKGVFLSTRNFPVSTK